MDIGHSIKDIYQMIADVKAKEDVYILAHNYQNRTVIEAADFVGDSYQLSVQATRIKHKKILLCGVRFMAETVKLLSPEKTVYLVNPEAGCPMTDQFDTQMLIQMREKMPDYTVVAYVNTTAEQKMYCDVCVTSSSAVKIVGNIENKNILFVPDPNLGDYVRRQLPDKNIRLIPGGCPTHAKITVKEAKKTKAKYPEAKMLVHPECIPEVVKLADFVGSTSQIIEYASTNPHHSYIIGTEISITEYLQHLRPDKFFVSLSKDLICPNMKIVTLVDVLRCLRGEGGEEMVFSDEQVARARKCIDEMVRLSQ